MSLALVYLARGVGNGLKSAAAFFNSYRAHPPGCPHELIVIAKGWSEGKERDSLNKMAKENAAKIIDLPDDGYDWGAYMRLAPHLSHEWVCFLNTHSYPIVTGWLGLMLKHAQSPTVGAVGATASWGTLLPIWASLAPRWGWRLLGFPIRLIINIFQFITNVRDFPCFPNPHLRSNAFLLKRELFNEFIKTRAVPRNKREAHMLESGKLGFTRFLTERALIPLVVGRDGFGYTSETWNISGTFRVPGHPNLLVSDNQTVMYENANEYQRKNLGISAWGRNICCAKNAHKST